jgi:hypothetical protein
MNGSYPQFSMRLFFEAATNNRVFAELTSSSRAVRHRRHTARVIIAALE